MILVSKTISIYSDSKVSEPEPIDLNPSPSLCTPMQEKLVEDNSSKCRQDGEEALDKIYDAS